MLARIDRYLKRCNYIPLNPSFWSFVNFKAHKDQTKVEISEEKGKNAGIDYAISEDSQVKIKDIDGKNITPIDVNPWNQEMNKADPKKDKNIEPESNTSVPNASN